MLAALEARRTLRERNVSENRLEYVALGHIHENPDNPRRNDEAVPAVAESIRRFGFNSPILVDGDGQIIAGHTRFKAAQVLGLGSVPVIRLTHLSAAEARAFNIADNKTAEIAQWDEYKLLEIVQQLQAEDGTLLPALGFSGTELSELVAKLGDPSATMAEALAELPDGERSPFTQMTFVLTHDQAERVREAMDLAHDLCGGDFGPTGNENGNGNALALVADMYVRSTRAR